MSQSSLLDTPRHHLRAPFTLGGGGKKQYEYRCGAGRGAGEGADVQHAWQVPLVTTPS